ncbi:cyclic nucleotide-binding domain-containing protein [bacterium]|nr:cyclic nucleotide-binding domain-containing protein [bacterium]
MVITDFLKQVEIFRNLADDELYEISRSVTELSVPKDYIIIEEGTPGDSLYIIKTGKVIVEKRRNERVTILAELEPPRFFGEMSLIDEYPHSARVTALENCEFLLINRLDLEIILNWNTVLGFKLWRAFSKVLSERLRTTNERIFEHMFTTEDSSLFKMWGEVIK